MAFENLTPQKAIWSNLGLKFLLDPVGSKPEDPQPLREFKTTLIKSQVELKKAPPAGKTPNKAQSVKAKSVWQPTPEKDWPQIWQSQLQKTRSGKICWLYWKLGVDLDANNPHQSEETKTERKNRSALLNKFFKELALPKGTHTFWPPVILECERELIITPDIFLSAMQKLQCRYVVVFGSAAGKVLLPESKLEPLRQYLLNGHIIWILRDIDVLCGRPDYYKATLDYLRRQIKEHPWLSHI